MNWTEEQSPNEECRYNHVFSEQTPLGKFRIEWKGWKIDPDYSVELVVDDVWDILLEKSSYCLTLDDAKKLAADYVKEKRDELFKFMSLGINVSTPSSSSPISNEELRQFDELALQAYCKQSESEGFIFTEYQGRSSQDESNGYCNGFQNGYKQALIDLKNK